MGGEAIAKEGGIGAKSTAATSRDAFDSASVGAGGIGSQLTTSIDSLRWADARVIFVAIFALVLVNQSVSARVRAAIT